MSARASFTIASVLTCVFFAAVALVSVAADGQTKKARGRGKAPKSVAREVTLTGRVVDVHCLMTGKFPKADRIKCTQECIKAGVPVALETDRGVFLLGTGPKSAAKTLAPLAYQLVDVRGKLYTRLGLKYIDLLSAKRKAAPPVKKRPADEEEDEDDEDEEGEIDEEDEEDDDEDADDDDWDDE
jgi:hypothetical protein